MSANLSNPTPDETSGTGGTGGTGGSDPEIRMVPRIVTQTQPTVDHGLNGRSPRVTSRQVMVTVWAPFGPIDYVRWLQRHTATQPRPTSVTSTAAWLIGVFGVVLVLIGVTSDTGHGAAPWGLIVLAVAGGLGFLTLRRTNPNQASSLLASYHQTAGLQDLRHLENPVGAAYHFSRAQAHERDIAARQARDHHLDQQDARYWAWAETQPLHYQWQLADWFTTCLDTEHTHRAGNRIQPDQSFVPTYADVVAILTATPIAW